MNSISEACNELKQSYDSCFNAWFSEKFLKGDQNHEVCGQLFSQYKECLKKAIKEQNMDIKEVEKEVLGTDEEVKFSSS